MKLDAMFLSDIFCVVPKEVVILAIRRKGPYDGYLFQPVVVWCQVKRMAA